MSISQIPLIAFNEKIDKYHTHNHTALYYYNKINKVYHIILITYMEYCFC